MARTFSGGVHPPEQKELSKEAAIRDLPVPGRVILPLLQHIGASCRPVVKKGDPVLKGQVIAEAGGFVSAPIHASTSGKVKAIQDYDHPLGRPIPAIIIEADGEDQWVEGLPFDRDHRLVSAKDLRAAVLEAGLAGMGGAAFPTHVKLSPPAEKPINTVIANGAECEPYLTCDYRLMLEHPKEIVEGLRLVTRAVNAPRGFIAIEDNKPDAFAIIRRAATEHPTLTPVLLPVKYPQGAEKQLIKALLDREVPSGGLPMDVGALVHNVGTLFAIYEAIRHGKPLIERVVTVTGEGVDHPVNLRCRIGTPIDELLKVAGLKPEAKRLILGGPMMGLAQFTTALPVLKGTSGILVLTDRNEPAHHVCIRCGRCVEACPAYLVPSELSILAEVGDAQQLTDYGILDCIECGCCGYVCPAERHMGHLMKYGKALVQALKAKAKEKA